MQAMPGVAGFGWTIVSAMAVVTASVLPLDAASTGKTISQLTHTAWSAKDGIPGPVRAIRQSAEGYLWLGTEVGLYRFDGIKFIESASLFAERLPGSSVWSLCVGRDGSLWIGLGSSGVSRLRDGRLTNYSPADGVPAGGILSIVEDDAGIVWAGGQYGFSRFEKERWQTVGKEFGYAAPGAQALFVDRQGTLYAATDGMNFGFSTHPVLRNTILTLDKDATRFKPTGLAVGQVWSMGAALDGSVWMADTNMSTVRPLSGPGALTAGITFDSSTMCLLFDNSNRLWVGLIDAGVRGGRAYAGSQVSGNDFARYGEADGLSGDVVLSALKDREGNVWFGTTAGLDRFRENKVTSYSKGEGLNPDRLVALSSAGPRGVWTVSYTSDELRRIEQGRITTSKLPRDSASDSPRILSLFSDAAGRAWVGGSFALATEVNGQFRFVHRSEIEAGANVEAIAVDAAGDLWIAETGWNAAAGTPSAPKILRLSQGKWTDFSSLGILPAFKARVLYAEAQRRVWIGFENGAVVKYQNGAFQTFSSKDGLPEGRVLAVTSDRNGHVWIAGEGGLSRFENGRFTTLSPHNGLLGSSVSAMLEDDAGNLWLACAMGILRVSKAEIEKALASPTYRMTGLAIGAADGLRGLPRQRQPFPTAARAADGTLWFATSVGVAMIDPNAVPINRVRPPVVIESITADDKIMAVQPDLELPPRTRTLQFDFAALSLTDPDRVQFQYKLDGYDEDWHGPITSRRLTYTNLPPGQYRLQLIAANNDGVWNREGATLAFRILPAFYQTLAFRLAGFGAIAAIAWLIYRRRVSLVARRLNLRHEERLSERERIARELHDTLLQGAYGLILRFHAVAEQIAPSEPARRMMNEALDRADEVVREARDRVEGLRTRAMPDLSDAFTRAGNELARDRDTDLRLIVEGRSETLHDVVRDEAYWIGREALINAFHAAGARHVELELIYGQNELRLRCRDDGRGIDPALLGAGGRPGHWGIQGMRERASRIGADLEISSREGAGTEVDLRVPASIAYAHRRSRFAKWFPWFGVSTRAERQS